MKTTKNTPLIIMVALLALAALAWLSYSDGELDKQHENVAERALSAPMSRDPEVRRAEKIREASKRLDNAETESEKVIARRALERLLK